MSFRDDVTAAFEAGEIAGADFPHEAHVYVAWTLAHRYPRDEAYERLATGIRTMAARSGRPDAFHETITRAWFELIANTPVLDEGSELYDRRLLARYYSAERLAAGRQEWLEPDLRPLVLPASGSPGD
jgi:hypothetical protein